MEYKNPKYNADGNIDLELNHPTFGWIPFTASPDDVEKHGRDLFEDLKDIAEPYMPTPEGS